MAIILFLSFGHRYLSFSSIYPSSLRSNHFFFLSHLYVANIQARIRAYLCSFHLESPELQPLCYFPFLPNSPPHPTTTPHPPHHVTTCNYLINGRLRQPCCFTQTWPFASILAFALVLAFDCAVVEMPRLMPTYPKGWAREPTWKFR